VLALLLCYKVTKTLSFACNVFNGGSDRVRFFLDSAAVMHDCKVLKFSGM
jgi:hypothetical protein